MRKYLSTLHQRPDRHKDRFAFLASASITLFIFAIWSFVKFGDPTLATEDENKGSLLRGVAAAWQSVWPGMDEVKNGLEQVTPVDTIRYQSTNTDGR